MYWFLLKKALPFALTFLFGAMLSGLGGLFGWSGKKADTPLATQTYNAGRGCRMRSRHHAAESKPLAIRFQPAVDFPVTRRSTDGAGTSARVRVTFGADGTVRDVRPLASWFHGRDESLARAQAMWEAVEGAARRIEFTPQTMNGVPVSVTREIEMEFAPAHR